MAVTRSVTLAIFREKHVSIKSLIFDLFSFIYALFRSAPELEKRPFRSVILCDLGIDKLETELLIPVAK